MIILNGVSQLTLLFTFGKEENNNFYYWKYYYTFILNYNQFSYLFKCIWFIMQPNNNHPTTSHC